MLANRCSPCQVPSDDEFRRQCPCRLDPQLEHRPLRRPPALGRRAGVEDPRPPRRAPPRAGACGRRRPRRSRGSAPRAAPRARPPGRRCAPSRSRAAPASTTSSRGRSSLQRRLVDVPVHRAHRRAERAELLEERDGDEVAAVQDQVGAAQPLDARRRAAPRAPRGRCVSEMTATFMRRAPSPGPSMLPDAPRRERRQPPESLDQPALGSDRARPCSVLGRTAELDTSILSAARRP